MENYQIDNLDRGILEALMANARTAYAELAKQFGVSPGLRQRQPPSFCRSDRPYEPGGQ
jgi:DNA-binding Lrp family transcriptional regulator